jgi:ABC-type phosphate/phosphonate transport system substrate-binding protein
MFSRRRMLATGGVALALPALRLQAKVPFRLGLTPVFLDNDAVLIDRLHLAFSVAIGDSVELEQRRTYEEVTELLLEGAIDAAWLCGFPYLQHRNELSLLAVPVWNGKPVYQSYLISAAEDDAAALDDFRGATHAFSDPNSNSGYLVTVSDLARKGLKPEEFFGRTIFTFGHRNVVRAVAGGLVRSGSVDGYVWEALARTEPGLTQRTKVVARSEWLGFPPFCMRTDRDSEPEIRAMRKALLELHTTDPGRTALKLLQLDSMTLAEPSLYDGIAKRIRELENFR